MIVVLNGASSVGKSSLARELQISWAPTPLIDFSLDSVIGQLPFAFTGSAARTLQGFPIMTESTSTISVGVGEYGLRLNALAAGYVSSIAQAGFDVVVDYVFLNQAMLSPFIERCAGTPTFFVGMFCETEQLAQRNASRADRINGLAVNQQSQVHFCRDAYDLELDSSNATPAELALQVQKSLRAWTPRSGFK